MKPTWFVRGDIDGFFGLCIDNVLQLMLIVILCHTVCGLPMELVEGKILPGAAISILVGNLFYSYQAFRLAQKTGRTNVTALPYGINTVSLIAFVLFIMAPVYHETGDVTLTWRVGLFACLISGLMELFGSFFANIVRKYTPRAALLSALAGIAITFISMGFIFQIFASPAIAIVPMMLILLYYSSGLKMPFGIPGGLFAVGTGVVAAWCIRLYTGTDAAGSIHPSFSFHLPVPVIGDAFALITDPSAWKYLNVIFPMALFNLIGSLQNLESAEAAGDSYQTRSSLLANGIGGVSAALFGSPFPTTIYIGHPGWKAMGARIGYSALNGIVITMLCLVGGVTMVLQVIPLEATLGILLWIGLIIMAQSFQEVPKSHALAVAFGLIPAFAAWALFLVETTLRKAGTNLLEAAPKFGNDLFIYGVMNLSQGFILTSMILSATLVFMIEREFLKAAFWMVIAALLSAVGLIHAYVVSAGGLQNKFGWWEAPQFAFAYFFTSLVLVGFHYAYRKKA